MNLPQSAILSPLSRHCRYLTFSLSPDASATAETLKAFCAEADSTEMVIGLGLSLVQQLKGRIDDLRQHPVMSSEVVDIPSTPAALWVWLKDDDRGELHHRSRQVELQLQAAFELEDVTDGFMYREGRDLSGYVDGTENPQGEGALAAGFVDAPGKLLHNSSFVAVQKWVHDLDRFESFSPEQRDHTIGRAISDNHELDDAPPSAHVKRTAQESFNPEAFLLRRSMPWADDMAAGLMFVAFGKSFDAFETLLDNMTGKNDGITDALFSFTKPVSGSYYWCPPLNPDGRFDLKAVGIA